MTKAPRVSVVIASHGRADLLTRAAMSIYQQEDVAVELIVVADGAGLMALGGLPFAARIKTARLDNENLSQARNIGIGLAAGEIIAFLDDDACAEPAWLVHLRAALARVDCAAVTGAVLGRNGLSLQWARMGADLWGRDQPISEAHFPKLHGTNMAIKADILRQMGGFDEAYRFYLEDTDLALRLTGAGYGIGYVDLGLIHHATAPSTRRDARRRPLSLSQIGASQAVFLTRHCPEGERDAAWQEFANSQEIRLERLIRQRLLSQSDKHRLMDELAQGRQAGLGRARSLRHDWTAPPPFQPLRDGTPRASVILHGPSWRASELREKAAALAAQGLRPSLFLFAPSARAHWLRFDPRGFWEQSGGLLGRSDRTAPRISLMTPSARVRHEMRRVAKQRLWDENSCTRAD